MSLTKKIIIMMSATFLLAGCSTAIMKPVTYQKPVDVQTHQDALLYWDQGTVIAKEAQATSAGMAIDVALAPNAFKMQYGPAQQVIFMTSLRNQLQQHGIFNVVTLETLPKTPNKNQVLIDVWFKKTEVLSTSQTGTPIALDVMLYIKAYNKPLYTQEYTLKIDNTFWQSMSYSFEDETDAISQKLMDSLMQGIVEWYHKNP